MKRYRPWNPKQKYLLPPSMSDWLAEDHLVYFILDVVGSLDLSPIEEAIQGKDARGERPYHPQMMVALIIYSYCVGVYSSRRMERATHEDIAFRVLTGDSQPHFTTINEFRRGFRQEFSWLFLQAVQLCQRAGLVKLGHVAQDGSKILANASKHKAMSYKRMKEEEKRLRKEIEEMLKRADAIDAEEDELYGVGQGEFELPDELKRRKDRLKKIAQAKKALEDEARKQRAKDLREQAEGMRESADKEERESVQKRLRGNAQGREEQADKLAPREPSEDKEDEVAETDLLQKV
jgi:transposase